MVKLQFFLANSIFTPIFKILVRTLGCVHIHMECRTICLITQRLPWRLPPFKLYIICLHLCIYLFACHCSGDFLYLLITFANSYNTLQNLYMYTSENLLTATSALNSENPNEMPHEWVQIRTDRMSVLILSVLI